MSLTDEQIDEWYRDVKCGVEHDNDCAIALQAKEANELRNKIIRDTKQSNATQDAQPTFKRETPLPLHLKNVDATPAESAQPVASSACSICGCVAPHSHNSPDENGHYHWMAVDLDGTLAVGAKHIDPLVIGEPIRRMVDQVKDWLRDGIEVRIFTARTSKGKDNRDVYAVTVVIQDWCEKHIGQRLPVTNIKQHGIIELWDDRAVNPVRVNKDVDGLLTLLAKEKRKNENAAQSPTQERVREIAADISDGFDSLTTEQIVEIYSAFKEALAASREG